MSGDADLDQTGWQYLFMNFFPIFRVSMVFAGCVAQSVACLIQEPEVLGSIPAGFPRVRETSGNFEIFQGLGFVWEF